ncbi:hypothetical protein G039_0324575 [Pseudomonas aeruginosa VRFPA01]|nr:hypothetical protein G039_0324575 [Pseudomonas aeruginosa VRFPA01]
MKNATSQGPSLRRANSSRSRVFGCCGSSADKPKRARIRRLSQSSALARQAQSRITTEKSKTIAGRSRQLGKRSSSSARASWNWLPHSATGLFAPWNCFSRLVRVSPIRPSTPPSLSLPFLVTSRSCFSFFNRSARCLSFSRVWITWFSDCSNCASLTLSPPEELPASGFGSAAAPGGE